MEEEGMNLYAKQRTLLKALTTEWRTHERIKLFDVRGLNNFKKKTAP
ncbi:hypothetical protein [Bacillus salipaludis]|uniref:Uncharacterized protein n=1 Tax=Bacillus salipaludis TaxID=2547811 RepID=A0AA90R2L9_9BACI|nr:hypothetical protein [Bacillus salipaludis]MDQ6595631.1 hypothetical protein [Bacillus salipaludis]